MQLAHDLFITPENNFVHGVLFIHGWNSDRYGNSFYARELAECGFITMAIDLPGHGESPGDIEELTRPEYLAAIVEATEFLQMKGCSKISIVAASFGAYLAARTTVLTEIESLVLRVPANYSDFDEDLSMPEIRSKLSSWDELTDLPETKAERALAEFSGEVMIIESGKDEIIPPEIIERYCEATPHSRYELMKEAEHTIGMNQEMRNRFGELLIDFFTQQ